MFGLPSQTLLWQAKHTDNNQEFVKLCVWGLHRCAVVATLSFCYISHSDSTAFLFTLTNPSDTFLRLEVIESENAVFHYLENGPVFGRLDNNRHCDLSFYGFDDSRNCTCLRSYEFPILSANKKM